MAAEFDPYHKWLGIPPEEQPPNHYRLLAIKLFEDDPDVIKSAAPEATIKESQETDDAEAPPGSKAASIERTLRACNGGRYTAWYNGRRNHMFGIGKMLHEPNGNRWQYITAYHSPSTYNDFFEFSIADSDLATAMALLKDENTSGIRLIVSVAAKKEAINETLIVADQIAIHILDQLNSKRK